MGMLLLEPLGTDQAKRFFIVYLGYPYGGAILLILSLHQNHLL